MAESNNIDKIYYEYDRDVLECKITNLENLLKINNRENNLRKELHYSLNKQNFELCLKEAKQNKELKVKELQKHRYQK